MNISPKTIAELLTPVKSAKRPMKDGPRLLMCGDGKMRRIPPPKSTESLANYLRLRSKFENRGYKTPCQVWIGSIGGGYGMLRVGGRARKVHRMSWLLNCGPIPNGLEVCHSCDQPDCFRVDHLFIGTHQQNMDDATSKKRWDKNRCKGELHYSRRFSEIQVLDLRKKFDSGILPSVAMAETFNVSYAALMKIKLRKSWKHL